MGADAVTQPIQYGPENTDLLQDALREIPFGKPRDKFIWNLVGVMLCYVERDSLVRCIDVAKKGLKANP